MADGVVSVSDCLHLVVAYALPYPVILAPGPQSSGIDTTSYRIDAYDTSARRHRGFPRPPGEQIDFSMPRHRADRLFLACDLERVSVAPEVETTAADFLAVATRATWKLLHGAAMAWRLRQK